MYKYKAFISYSRAADTRLAPELKSALQRFAKPWYQLRAIQVFCDQTNLTANPNLWSSIEQALDNCEYFIYLASPQAAQSKWVHKELQAFKQKRGSQNIIIVLTDGSILWNDGAAGDFLWNQTNSVPKLDTPLFSQEPTWLDLTWIRKEQLSVRDPRFLDAVANLSSALRGIDKDILIGQDVAQYRKAKRFRRFSIAGLVVLALFLIAAAVTAIRSEQRSQERLVKTFSGNGNALLENGDYLSALLWYVEAISSERGADRKDMQRLRINNLINQLPVPVQAWHSALPVIACQFLDSNRLLLLSADLPDEMQNEYPCNGEEICNCYGTIRVLNMRSGADVFDSIAVKDGIKRFAVSQAAQTLATLSVSNILSLWNLNTGKLMWERPCDPSMNRDILQLGMDIDEEGKRVFVTKGSLLQVFDTKDGAETMRYNAEGYGHTFATFLNSDTLVFIEGSLRFLDIGRNKTVSFKIPGFEGQAFKISPDKQHIAIAGTRAVPQFGGSGTVSEPTILYTTLRQPDIPLFVKTTEEVSNKIEFDRSGKILAVNSGATPEGGSSDFGSHAWRTDDGNILTDAIKLSEEVWIAMAGNGRQLIVTSSVGSTQLWDVSDENAIAEQQCLLHDGGSGITATSNADDYLITVTDRQMVKLWKLPDPELMRSSVGDRYLSTEQDTVLPWFTLSKGSDDTTITDPSVVRIMDRKSGKPIGKPMKTIGEVYNSELSPDGRLVVITSSVQTSVWRRDNQQHLFSFPADNHVISLRFSKDGKKIVTSHPNLLVRVWDAMSGKPLSPYIHHSGGQTFDMGPTTFFSSDGNKVITGASPSIYRIWDAASGEPLSGIFSVPDYDGIDGKDSIPVTNRLLKQFDAMQYSIDDLRNYVEMITNQRLDESGSLVKLTTGEYMERWNKWKRN